MAIKSEAYLDGVPGLRVGDEFPSWCCDHGTYTVEVALDGGARGLTHCTDCGCEWTLTVIGVTRRVIGVTRHVADDT